MSEINMFMFSTTPVPDHPERIRVRMEQPGEQDPAVYKGQEAAWRIRRKVFATAAGIAGTSEAKMNADARMYETPACVVPDWFEVSQGAARPGVGFMECTVENMPKRLCGKSKGKDAGKAMLRFLEWWFRQFELNRVRGEISE